VEEGAGGGRGGKGARIRKAVAVAGKCLMGKERTTKKGEAEADCATTTRAGRCFGLGRGEEGTDGLPGSVSNDDPCLDCLDLSQARDCRCSRESESRPTRTGLVVAVGVAGIL